MRSNDIKLVALCGEMTLHRCPECGELKEASSYKDNSSWCYTCRRLFNRALYASQKMNDKQTAAKLRKDRYRYDELYRLHKIDNQKKHYPSHRKKCLKDRSRRYYMTGMVVNRRSNTRRNCNLSGNCANACSLKIFGSRSAPYAVNTSYIMIFTGTRDGARLARNGISRSGLAPSLPREEKKSG